MRRLYILLCGIFLLISLPAGCNGPSSKTDTEDPGPNPNPNPEPNPNPNPNPDPNPDPNPKYELPDLPPMPTVLKGPANSVAMRDPADFPEVQMDFSIQTNGPFEPTWPSIAANVPGNGTPEWLRQAKFGIWFHYGPQSSLGSGDWSAQHMYQQNTHAYNNHLTIFGEHPSIHGYKDVIKEWNPYRYNPTELAKLFYSSGARFVLVQGVHHDNFDNWNSKYNPWNIVNFAAKRDTMAEWVTATRNLGMRMGVAFHHEYSWWFTQPSFLSDSSGEFEDVPYDAATVTNDTNSNNDWWKNYEPRLLYYQDLHKYAGISTPNTGYWNPSSGIFSNDLEYCHWYATQWALRILDVVENYDPDFIYTDGNSTQPFSGYMTGTGYKCNAMQRVIAHYYNRTLERHGKLDTLAVVKFHTGDHIGTTYEGNFSSAIKTDQPWFAELAFGDWFWRPNISYDQGAKIIHRLLEAISRDGAMMVNVPNRPDGSLDSGATDMLTAVGRWMGIHGEGVYGSRAWAIPTESNFRFVVGSNGYLYAFHVGIPAPNTVLNISSLGLNSEYLLDKIGSVSMLGSTVTPNWSQTASSLQITCPSVMPSIPSGTAVGFKIGPVSAIGDAAPSYLTAFPETDRISLSWSYSAPGATFNVKRSTDGGVYTTIASGLQDLAYTDTDVSPGILYHYRVSSIKSEKELNSSPVSAALITLPSNNWLSTDIGEVGKAGSFSQSNGDFEISGSGKDIWYDADEFHYVFQAVKGNYMLTARVVNMQNTASWAKAGIMMRESLAASSKYVLNFVSPSKGIAFQQRKATSGGAEGVKEYSNAAAPYWVRLVRNGDLFVAYRSADGANWTAIGKTEVSMNKNIYVGLAVCSVNDGTICQASFDNVKLENISTE